MNLVDRVKNILLTPRTEWLVIEREPGDAAYLFKNYVAILAAVPTIAGLIGSLIKGMSLGSALLWAVVSYLMTFAVTYLIAMIINFLAPKFGGVPNSDSALKLSVYSGTPWWLAGIFALVPALAFLAILGLYGFYLLYLGASPLMRVPAEKSLGFTATVVISAIVLFLVLGYLLIRLLGLPV